MSDIPPSGINSGLGPTGAVPPLPTGFNMGDFINSMVAQVTGQVGGKGGKNDLATMLGANKNDVASASASKAADDPAAAAAAARRGSGGSSTLDLSGITGGLGKLGSGDVVGGLGDIAGSIAGLFL